VGLTTHQPPPDCYEMLHGDPGPDCGGLPKQEEDGTRRGVVCKETKELSRRKDNIKMDLRKTGCGRLKNLVVNFLIPRAEQLPVSVALSFSCMKLADVTFSRRRLVRETCA
jgi:hypothetical protein